MRYNFINKADLVAFLEQKAEETKRNIIIKKNDEVWQRCEKYMYLHFANIVKNSNITTTVE